MNVENIEFAEWIKSESRKARIRLKLAEERLETIRSKVEGARITQYRLRIGSNGNDHRDLSDLMVMIENAENEVLEARKAYVAFDALLSCGCFAAGFDFDKSQIWRKYHLLSESMGRIAKETNNTKSHVQYVLCNKKANENFVEAVN